MKSISESGQRDQRCVQEFYGLYDETYRLKYTLGELERVRSCAILERVLPPPPAVVLDIGGGPGVYLRWLLERGYHAHLVDPVESHIHQAQAVVADHTGSAQASARLGNALALEFEDTMADAVLLMGPLYHLLERDDRVASLVEARRVLRSGGVVVAAAIPRFASLLDGLNRRVIQDPDLVPIVRRDLQDGQHHNPTDKLEYFTDVFLHHPDELEAEVRAAGFEAIEVLAVEGPAWVSGNLDEDWQNPAFRALLLEFLQTIEAERSLLGVSPHLLAIGRVP